MRVTVGSLFSGIGGLDLGLERAGMRVVWQCEADAWCSRVLAKHWPGVPNFGDVTAVDWSHVEPVDVVCGGYPCQPFSLAGQRKGESDVRHLWPYFADAVRYLRPRVALLENVPGHLSLGFGRVLGDLAELGYDCEWDCIPAAAVGAPHLRYRVFVVAHADSEPGVAVDAEPRPRVLVPDADSNELREQPVSQRRGSGPAVFAADGENRDVADADLVGRDGGARALGPIGRPEPENCREVGDPDGAPADTFTAERRSRGPAGESGWWAVEPPVGRVADGVPGRVDRLRGLGNAVVPQVAEWIGRQLVEHLTVERAS